MELAEYIEILEGLGCTCYEFGKPLKFPNLRLPPITFNRGRDRNLYFAAFKRDIARFPESFWEHVPERHEKNMQKGRITVVPLPGKEQQALERLVGKVIKTVQTDQG